MNFFILCHSVIVINFTETWNKFDQNALERATKRCGQIYKDAPCLKKFYKVSDLRYKALCSKSK